MPRKIRDLLKDYRKAGASIRIDQGKGSHRKIFHKNYNERPITLSGTAGSDAKPYQEKDLKKFLRKIKA